jgi:hypothetical protein
VELPRPAGAHPDVPHIPSLYDIVERLHGLLNRRIRVEAVALQKVNVIQLEPLERSFDGVEYMLYETFSMWHSPLKCHSDADLSTQAMLVDVTSLIDIAGADIFLHRSRNGAKYLEPSSVHPTKI